MYTAIKYTAIKYLHVNAQNVINITNLSKQNYDWKVYTDKHEPVKQFSETGTLTCYSLCLPGWFLVGIPKSHYDNGIASAKLYQYTGRCFIKVSDFESLSQFMPLFKSSSPRIVPIPHLYRGVYSRLGLDVKLEHTALIKVGDAYQPIGKVGSVRQHVVNDHIPDIYILPQDFFDLIEPVFHQLSPVIDEFEMNGVMYSRVIYVDLNGKWSIYLIERDPDAPGRVTSDLWLKDEIEFVVSKIDENAGLGFSPMTSAFAIDSRQSEMWNDLVTAKIKECYQVTPSVRLIPKSED